MSRALLLSLPLHGHTNPSLPLVRELTQRGHQVVYCSTEPFREKVLETGATFHPYRSPILTDMHGLPERIEELVWLLMQATRDVLDTQAEELRSERPDFLITDATAPWGQWLGELLGIPVVTSVSTFAFNRYVLAFGVSRGVRPKNLRVIIAKLRALTKSLLLARTLRRRHRLRGPGTFTMMFGHSALNVVYTSREFQPRVETFDDSYLFVGPSMAARHEAAVSWRRAGGRRLVYVSLGTIFNRDVSFYRSCVDAFRDADFDVVMSVGSDDAVRTLGTPPPNISLFSYVPQLEVLGEAAVFVTHGGMNSVSESLSFGVPMVVIPQIGEQAIVGRQTEEQGAGQLIPKDRVSAGALREAVQRVLDDETFRERATRIGESFRSAGGVRRAADAIEAFVSKGPAGTSRGA